MTWRDLLAGMSTPRDIPADLVSNGLVGTALVRTMIGTSVGYGSGAFSERVVVFGLDIDLPGSAPYSAQTQQTLPNLRSGAVLPGSTVLVRVDPSNPGRVAIDFDSVVGNGCPLVFAGTAEEVGPGAQIPLRGFRFVPDCWAIDWAAFPPEVLR